MGKSRKQKAEITKEKAEIWVAVRGKSRNPQPFGGAKRSLNLCFLLSAFRFQLFKINR
jgi:hypothetical protein